MGTVVSLRQARKTKARGDKQRRANQNAAKFGRSKAQKALETQDSEKATRHLDGHKRDDRSA